MLANPDIDNPFAVYMDASEWAGGGINAGRCPEGEILHCVMEQKTVSQEE